MGYFRFLAANPRFLSFGYGLNVFVALGQTFYISLYNTDIRIALSLSHGELAAIYGTATMVGSIGVFALGRLLDRVDLRLFAGATTVAVALGCWMLARAMTIPALFLAIFIIRLTAQGLWGTTVLVSMARYFDTERGKAAAVANTGYAMGFAIFPVAGAWLLANYDWRTAWALSGWFVLLVILPVIMIQLWGHGDRHRRYEARLEELTEGPREIRVRQWTLPEVLKDVRFWLIQPALVSAPSIIFSIQFHQLYIVDSKGWALSTYASSYMVYAVTSLLATLVAGVVIDRYGSRPLSGGHTCLDGLDRALLRPRSCRFRHLVGGNVRYPAHGCDPLFQRVLQCAVRFGGYGCYRLAYRQRGKHRCHVLWRHRVCDGVFGDVCNRTANQSHLKTKILLLERALMIAINNAECFADC
jgi:MFS family permease